PLLFGVDDALDPRKFALFGIPDRELARALALAALVGVPAVVLFVCSLSTVITWSRDPGAAVLAVLSALIVVPTCVLASRISTAIASLLVPPRRSKEAGGVVAILALVLVAPVLLLLLTVDWGRDGLGTLNGFASWLQWTPLGAAWSMPGAAAEGDGGAAFVQFLIAVDARYWVALVMIPVIPVFVIVALALGGLPIHFASLVPLPLVCLFLGWTIHNDVAFDSTAIWLHLVSGTRGISDRLGRMFPPVLIGIPVIVVGSLVTAAVFGDWAVLPAIAALCGSILVIGLGLSSLFSVVFLALGLTVNPFWLGISPIASVLVGFAALGGGLWAGARAFDKRGPELMAFANRND
ncbi:hypothetical protein ACFVUP_38740, partial [Streptomyces bacillaris]|uniref:hypothetical protein n=1 Tax=Streptomyces bacillaris TaxID=68179 RepID=UPI0036DDB2B5